MSYSETMQHMVRVYRSSKEKWPASSREIAQWAISSGHWVPQPSAIVAQCADQISKALRDEYFTDPQGRRVRLNHAAHSDDEQLVLWDDIRTAKPEHMMLAFQQRRLQILGDCKQLKNDADSYNENRKPDMNIQMVFDFTLDLEESDLVKRRAA
jgi:hypothetical protein